MTNITTLRKKLLLGVVLSLLLASGGLMSPQKAQAVSYSDYYDVLGFYGDTDNSAILKIYVKSNFTLPYGKIGGQWFCASNTYYQGNVNVFTLNLSGTNYNAVIDEYSIKKNGVLVYSPDNWECYSPSFEAGYNYEFKLTSNVGYGGQLGVWMKEYYYQNGYGWFYPLYGDYIYNLFSNPYPNSDLYNTNQYDYFPSPTLTISFPPLNATTTIAEAFNISGSYVNPSGLYDYLVVFFYDYINNYTTHFEQIITNIASGSVDIRISGLPASNYNLEYDFLSNEAGYYFTYKTSNIILVNAIPPELPFSTTTPPLLPEYLGCDSYYQLHSNYSSSTNLFNSICSALSPLLGSVSNNLTAFNDRFSSNNAVSSGSQFGGAILAIRGYANNLNSLFNNAPVSQALTFYIILFLAVIIFRLIRGLINLIKL